MARAVLAVLCAENEGLAICALAHCGVLFVAANADLFKTAVALTGVVCALHNSAGNGVIVLLFHFEYQPFAKSDLKQECFVSSMHKCTDSIQIVHPAHKKVKNNVII